FGVIGPKSQKAFQQQWRKVGRLNARVEESFSGHARVKGFGREQDSLDKFEAENEELYQSAFKAQFLSNIIMPGMTFIGSLTYAGIAVLGGILVTSGQLRLGDVQAFIQYSQQFTQPLSELGGMAAVVQSGTASAERVFELLDADEQEPDSPDAPALRQAQGPGWGLRGRVADSGTGLGTQGRVVARGPGCGSGTGRDRGYLPPVVAMPRRRNR
ncbi:MAG: ABC transporter ATP-binding protein, partial [Plantibacter flavus]